MPLVGPVQTANPNQVPIYPIVPPPPPLTVLQILRAELANEDDEGSRSITPFFPPPPPTPVPSTCTLLIYDNFNRVFSPGYGITTPGGAPWDAPTGGVVGTPGSTGLVEVTGTVGKMSGSIIDTSIMGGISSGYQQQERLPAVITNINEYIVSADIVVNPDYPIAGFGPAGPLATVEWDFGVVDATLAHATRIVLTLIKGSNPISYDTHLIISDLQGGTLANVHIAGESFPTPLVFSVKIDRSLSRGTVQVTVSHFNFGLPYEKPIVSGGASTIPIRIYQALFASSADIPATWTTWYATIDNLFICSD